VVKWYSLFFNNLGNKNNTEDVIESERIISLYIGGAHS